MKKWIILIFLGGIMLPATSPAIDLKQAKFTQVVNNVEIISATDKSRHDAAVNDVFLMPDVLRTGPEFPRGTCRDRRHHHTRRSEHDFFLRPIEPHD